MCDYEKRGKVSIKNHFKQIGTPLSLPLSPLSSSITINYWNQPLTNETNSQI